MTFTQQRTARRYRLSSPRVRFGLSLALVAAAYYLSARLGLRFALISKNVTPLWPPTGIAVVALLLLGRRVWPGVALAAFLVNLPITTNPLAALVTAAGNTLAPVVAVTILHAAHFRRELDRLRDAAAIVLAAIVGMLISATVGAETLVVSHTITADRFPTAWAVWWTGDAMGVLVVAPFLLSLLLFDRRGHLHWARLVEAIALFAALAVASLLVAGSRYPLLFLVLPLLGWAAWRFRMRGAAPAALLVAAVVTWAADHKWGLFASDTVLRRMMVLQAFNATVALTSFVFAALVAERLQGREALERSAKDLEERVTQRTTELTIANRWLAREVADRQEAERRLRLGERQLAEAQRVARVGNWEWLIEENQVTWSDEMYRIYGHAPQEFPVTFERALEQVVPEDLERLRSNLSAAFAKGREHTLPPTEFRIAWSDGTERILLSKTRLAVGPDGKPSRMFGTIQDVTEEKQAEREHRIAETLQRSLLPDQLPDIPGVSLAARYVPATKDVEVGGDWYDVIQLPNGCVGVAIGDVAGHGLRAASTMGQLRMALRAYAVDMASPAEVVGRVARLTRALDVADMATLMYMVFDPDSCDLTFSNAGHPPPLLIGESGTTTYMEAALAPPLSPAAQFEALEGATKLAPGSTLVLFTDGLIERRAVPLREGLRRLEEAAAGVGDDLEAFCDHLLAELLEDPVGDDIALLALRPERLSTPSLQVDIPSDPRALAPLRRAVRRWLRENGVGPEERNAILVACGEACANAIQHPYGAATGRLHVALTSEDGEVEVRVRDAGTWRPRSPEGGGLGLMLMRELMDSVEVATDQSGTLVRMRRRVRSEDADERAGTR